MLLFKNYTHGHLFSHFLNGIGLYASKSVLLFQNYTRAHFLFAKGVPKCIVLYIFLHKWTLGRKCIKGIGFAWYLKQSSRIYSASQNYMIHDTFPIKVHMASVFVSLPASIQPPKMSWFTILFQKKVHMASVFVILPASIQPPKISWFTKLFQ